MKNLYEASTWSIQLIHTPSKFYLHPATQEKGNLPSLNHKKEVTSLCMDMEEKKHKLKLEGIARRENIKESKAKNKNFLILRIWYYYSRNQTRIYDVVIIK